MHKRLLDALLELHRFELRGSDHPFWWRRASMKTLAEMGLTEAYVPATVKTSKAYRLTTAGKQAVAGSGSV